MKFGTFGLPSLPRIDETRARPAGFESTILSDDRETSTTSVGA